MKSSSSALIVPSKCLWPVLMIFTVMCYIHSVLILASVALFLIFAVLSVHCDKRGPVAPGPCRTIICPSFFFPSLILLCLSAVVSLGRSSSQSSIRLSHRRVLRENADLSSSLVLRLVFFSPVFFFLVSLISLCSFILALLFAPKPHRL